MTDFETHPVGTADLVTRLREWPEGYASEAADRIEQLEAQATELGNFLAAYMAEAMTAGRTVAELTEALTRANAATAAAYEVVSKQLAASRETFCYASPGSDEEFTSLLLGFDTAAGILSSLATPDQTAALDRLIAEAEDHAAETAAQFVHKRLYEANMPACSYHSRDIKAAILSASKKGGA